MLARFFAFFVVAVCISTGGAAAADEEFFFRDGDRVVVIGDSITEQHLYSNYLEMWTVSRFPAWNITFRNVGIGGDRSPGGNGRFERDVLSHKPTAMTVDFGMNDGGYRPFDAAGYKTYMNGLQGMANQATAAGIRVAWVTPQPVEKNEDGPNLPGYNETLERYSAGVGEIAASNGGAFIDQFHPFLAVLDKARAADPKNRIGGGDAVHPGAPGQALMAHSILKGLKFPSLVSAIKIDAAAQTAEAENCQVMDLTSTSDGASFQRQDGAIPFFPVEAKSILAWAPLLEELNDYRLQVTGLNEGKYSVSLGGAPVAVYSAAELAKGVNLAAAALETGPVADQSREVWSAVKAKNSYYHDRIFRGVVLANVAIPDFLGINLSAADIEAKRQSAIAERLTKMPELDAAVRAALAPRRHKVEIAPAL